MSYACHLKDGELGVIVIALNSMEPLDYRDRFLELRERLTKAWAKQDPQAYAHGVATGQIEPFTPPEVLKAQAVLDDAPAYRGFAELNAGRESVRGYR
jgi:hypothetical protein